MFNANVDALGEDLSAMTLVYNHSQSVLCDIIDASGLSVISLEGHTFVDSTVTLKRDDNSVVLSGKPDPLHYLDIDIVSGFVHFHVGGQIDHSMVAEFAREHVARSTTVTVCSSHGCCLLACLKKRE